MLSLLWPFKALAKECHSNGPGWKGCWVEKLNSECRGLAGVSRGCSIEWESLPDFRTVVQATVRKVDGVPWSHREFNR